MIRMLAAFALCLALSPAAALAHSCPALMEEIDAALPEAELGDEDRARIEDLRAEGEAHHEAGDHDAAMASLDEARRILFNDL